MPLADVLASEDEVRTRSIEVLTPDVQTLLDEGYPVFLTGDLNQPSSLDYTEATVGMRKGVTEAIPWTVSEALLAIGLRDTFREIHPDPVENPGLTHGNPDFRKGGFGDRIDYLYAGGPAVTPTSELVGEVGGPNVDREYDPWTSDHRAVLSTFDVTPVELRADPLPRPPAAHRGRGARRPLQRPGKRREHDLGRPRGGVGGRRARLGGRHAASPARPRSTPASLEPGRLRHRPDRRGR